MESANIKSRVREWISLVNTKFSQFCQKLATNNNSSGSVHPMNSIPVFTSDLALKVGDYLEFIRKWAGINVKIPDRKPKTYQQYRTRAINWLNGRRPRIYDCNLFPDMLKLTKEVKTLYLLYIHLKKFNYCRNCFQCVCVSCVVFHSL